MRSLRSRLIAGMLLGMTLLLAATCVTLYSFQRRQLYRAFDDALLGSANTLVLLIHHGTPSFWFDVNELSELPPNRIRQGALFQFWSDYPISLTPVIPGPERGMGPGPPLPPPEGFGPPGSFRERNGPPGGLWGPPLEPPGQRRARRPDEFEEGVLVIRSPQLKGQDLPRLAASPGQPLFVNIELPTGGRGRAVSLELHWDVPERGLPRGMAAHITSVVAASTTEIEAQLRFLATLLALTALGTLIVSGGLVWLVVSRGLGPLDTVARKIAVLDESGLKQRILDQSVPREIEPVVQQLNGLLGRLDQAFDRERALTADVAHELRTPVAEIRAIAEITLSQTRSPEEYSHALDETLETTRTLQSLIEKLLILARLEAGQVKPELELAPLQPILAEHWSQLRGRAEARGITFEDACPVDLTVEADLRLLSVVLPNVLSNAVTYAPDGGRITVDIEQDETRCQVRITNTGCDLKAEDVPRVFDRFWRAESARSKSGLNCGLGLTLVRRAMEAMGGKAEAYVGPDACFTLALIFRRPESNE